MLDQVGAETVLFGSDCCQGWRSTELRRFAFAWPSLCCGPSHRRQHLLPQQARKRQPLKLSLPLPPVSPALRSVHRATQLATLLWFSQRTTPPISTASTHPLHLGVPLQVLVHRSKARPLRKTLAPPTPFWTKALQGSSCRSR